MNALGLALLRRLAGSEGVPPPDAPEWDGANAWLDDIAYDALRFITVGLFVVIAAAWPSDVFLFEAFPERGQVMREWRMGALALMVATLLLSWRWGLVRRHPTATLVVALWIAILWSSWSTGRLGSFDTPWPYYAYFSLMFTAPVPLRGRDRLVLSVGLCVAIFTGFCLLHPANLAHPLAGHALLFLVTVAALALILNEGVWASAVLHYFSRQRVRETKDALTALNQTLDQRVREQTAELRDLSRHLVEVQEAERNRIAGELHDDLGQQLAAVRFLISTALRGGPEQAVTALGEIQGLMGNASTSVRALAGTLRPLVVEQLGLHAACAHLTRTMGTSADLAYDYVATGSLDDLPKEIGVTVYRVLQEALTNVARHARATSVDVELTRDDAQVSLVVRDDGQGFVPKPSRDGGGMGIVGMRERAQAVGGTLSIAQARGGGTEMALRIPL